MLQKQSKNTRTRGIKIAIRSKEQKKHIDKNSTRE